MPIFESRCTAILIQDQILSKEIEQESTQLMSNLRLDYQVVECFRPAIAREYRFTQANMVCSLFSFFLGTPFSCNRTGT